MCLVERLRSSLDRLMDSASLAGAIVGSPAPIGAEALLLVAWWILAVAAIAASPRLEARCTGGLGRGLRSLREDSTLCSLGPARGAVVVLEVLLERPVIQEDGPAAGACGRGRGRWRRIKDLGEEAAIHRVRSDRGGPGLVGIDETAGELEEAAPGEEGVGVLRAAKAHRARFHSDPRTPPSPKCRIVEVLEKY
jgi:hypothetical protein